MTRGSFEGVWNVVRFNWHFYVIIFAIILLILLTFPGFSDFYQALSLTFVFIIIMPVLISLKVTHKIYDDSTLYELNWLSEYDEEISIASFNAGFDETTKIIRYKKPKAKVIALDFYDEQKHTEVSIKRARRAYPKVEGTLEMKSQEIPLPHSSIDLVIGFLSLHEIRDEAERVEFFSNIKKILNDQGEIIVIEHLRDTANFLAYNIGFLHFHSKATWQETFRIAGLHIIEEEKINPFMSKFRLSYGTTS